jgi:dienelactone hydrolase
MIALVAFEAHGGPLFTVDGVPPDRVVVTATPAVPERTPPASSMLRILTGVRAVLEGRDVRVLKSAFGRLIDPKTAATASFRRGAVLHLFTPGGHRVLEIARTNEGDIIAIDPASGRACAVDDRRLERLSQSWLAARPFAVPPDLPEAQVIDLPKPYYESPITMDDRTIGARFFGSRGRPAPWQPMDRVLSDERFSVRLPMSFRDDRPTGLLVWQSPTPEGGIPRTLHAAADALGLVCIGAHDAGNYRTGPSGDPADRFQLVLDAIETANRTWWIDAERVYVTGLSGGGRIASMMWHCFPDLVTGAVSIVGLNSPHTIPISRNTHSPPSYARPTGVRRAAVRGHRLAAITGPDDFNYPEMVARTRAHKRDKLDIRLFDIPGMAHTMPTPEAFLEAMAWVDEPVTQRRAEAGGRAIELLEAWERDRADPNRLSAEDRAALVRITHDAPWTDPAWRAAELLGYAEP